MKDEIRAAVDAAFQLLPVSMNIVRAQVEMYAIGYQESEFLTRRQYGNGPAASFWQFERTGGIIGVMQHHSSKELAAKVCAARGVAFDSHAIWNAMLKDDVLGAAFARLLLYTDPAALPAVPDVFDPKKLFQPKDPDAPASWRYYYRNWRPGRPHPEKWAASYAAGLKVVRGF